MASRCWSRLEWPIPAKLKPSRPRKLLPSVEGRVTDITYVCISWKATIDLYLGTNIKYKCIPWLRCP
jgi:hypothetical protein